MHTLSFHITTSDWVKTNMTLEESYLIFSNCCSYCFTAQRNTLRGKRKELSALLRIHELTDARRCHCD